MVELKNIKRSYKRLESLCICDDLCCFFCGREERKRIIREAKTVEEIFSYGVSLIWSMDNFGDYMAFKKAKAWVWRWGGLIGKTYEDIHNAIEAERKRFLDI